MTGPQAAGLAARLGAVRDRMSAACTAAGRDPGELTLVAVSKGIAAERVAEVIELGVADIGENKAQEAEAKAGAVATLAPEAHPRWHFIGQLQRNKAAIVARFASMVHSVDRTGLATALDRACESRPQPLDVLVQLDLALGDPDPARGGASPQELLALAEMIASLHHLRLRGVMTVAPQGEDARAAFDRLVGYSASLQAIQPSATVISAGMTGDLEAAISAGATHVRVGTALFGARKLASEHRT